MSEKWITEALSLVRLFLGIAVVALGSLGAWVFQNAAWPPPWRLWVGVGVMVGLAVACVGLLIWAVRMLNAWRHMMEMIPAIFAAVLFLGALMGGGYAVYRTTVRKP